MTSHHVTKSHVGIIHALHTVWFVKKMIYHCFSVVSSASSGMCVLTNGSRPGIQEGDLKETGDITECFRQYELTCAFWGVCVKALKPILVVPKIKLWTRKYAQHVFFKSETFHSISLNVNIFWPAGLCFNYSDIRSMEKPSINNCPFTFWTKQNSSSGDWECEPRTWSDCVSKKYNYTEKDIIVGLQCINPSLQRWRCIWRFSGAKKTCRCWFTERRIKVIWLHESPFTIVLTKWRVHVWCTSRERYRPECLSPAVNGHQVL